jgi:hypothetical protein
VAAVWARARAELRSDWRRGIGLALLIGLVGGAAIAAAGARRTDSALDRFNTRQRAADVPYLDDGEIDWQFHAGDLADKVAPIPVVATMARARYTYVLGNDGLLAPADGHLGSEVDRPTTSRGRLPRLVVPVAVVVANIVAAVPARVAALIKPALVLRTE